MPSAAESPGDGPSPALEGPGAPFRPRGRRIAAVPAIVQMEAVECGAACLVSVLAHHGRHVALEEARRACGVSRDGSSALQLTAAAAAYGMRCEGYSVESHELSDLCLPGILFWGFDHFVVLEGWRRGEWLVMDPAVGRRTVSAAEFDRKFTGVVLELVPGEDFRRGGRPHAVGAAVAERLRGSWHVVAAAAACGLLIAAPAFVLPALGAAFVDRVLLEGASRWLFPMIAVALGAMLASAALAHAQQGLLARLEQRLALSGGARLMEHVLRLPFGFFAHRYPGDIVRRIDSVEEIAELIAAKVAPAAVGALTSTLFLAAMILIDVRLSLVAVAAVGVVLLMLLRSGRALTEHARVLEKDIGIGAGTLAAGLSAIETVKASGRESDLYARIADANARTASSQQALERLTTTLTAVPELLVSLLVSAVVLSVGGWEVMQGRLSVGTLLAFQAVMVAAMGPVLDLAALGQEIQALRATMARIDDVLRHGLDPLAVPGAPAPGAPATAAAPAADTLEFRGVTFGYSEADEPVVRDLSFTVGPGRRVALVGATGSGKSTVAKLACGLCQPWSGEVLVDGRALASVPRHERATLMAVVGQSPVLFEASLRENLSMWDPLVPDEWMREAASDAGLAGLVESRGGLAMHVAEGGVNLSGGEAQRVEIARALSRRPSILVLDEATSSLDATTESRIDRALRRRGCSCLVIAHRLSTIRDADEIIVLDRGSIAERGSHEELVARGGAYAAFVRGGGQG